MGQSCGDYPKPRPKPGEALLRILLAGVCATDLQLTRGYHGGYRGVLGHEFVAEVVDAPGAPTWLGKRVAGEINIGCGDCDLCHRGLEKHCRKRSAVGINGHDGAFAEYLVLPVANLHPLPDTISNEEAVFIEPLAAAFQILEQVKITPQMRVFVQGDGRLGILCAQVIAQTGCDLTVIGHSPDKLALLRAAGVKQTALSTPELLVQLARSPADVVVEVTGAVAGLPTALALVRPAGTVVLKSTFADQLNEFDISQLVVDELTLVGSRCGPFPRAIGALANRSVAVGPLIHARFPLRSGVDALALAGQKGVLKVLIDPLA
ncbi:MAG: alcohol dehydrogenase catalytic domain-containing protein [Anaerolineales bacterium]|nr:alcohol dehydrogenase catalytic domain-containing protein [Anaerolineales bacterium]